MPTNKQRRDAARRHLERQLQQRQEREAKQKRRMLIATIAGTLVLAVIVVVVVVALGTGNSKKTPAAQSTSTASSEPMPSSTPVEQTSGPCAYVKIPNNNTQGLKNVGLPPDPKPTPTKELHVTFNTNRGVIEATLDGKNAPCNVQSLAYLIQKKFYDNTPCPRVVDSGIYVVQCGSGGNTTSGGPTYTVRDENLTKADYTAGTIAMANSGADTNGSQFFFITKDSNANDKTQTGLSKDYTVVGHVTKGLNILQQVAAGGNDGSAGQAGGGKPKLDLTFKTVRITSVVPAGPTPGAGPTPTIVVAPSATPSS